MITREERKKLVSDEFTFLAISIAYSLVDRIYDDIEAQLSNTEQLTCDGCAFEQGIYIPSHCILCSRDKKDHFESKDTK